ncbi:MAG TPA: hypothetical protein PKL84_07480 [Candidatus Hydrogenedentes bacterium]|nr:hypothetical protein [Candidatus Hydrogenedentota bacterium]
MTCSGYVKGGVVVLDTPDALPEGARVIVALSGADGQESSTPQSLYEQLEPIIGIIEGLPPDFADNHNRRGSSCQL